MGRVAVGGTGAAPPSPARPRLTYRRGVHPLAILVACAVVGLRAPPTADRWRNAHGGRSLPEREAPLPLDEPFRMLPLSLLVHEPAA